MPSSAKSFESVPSVSITLTRVVSSSKFAWIATSSPPGVAVRPTTPPYSPFDSATGPPSRVPFSSKRCTKVVWAPPTSGDSSHITAKPVGVATMVCGMCEPVVSASAWKAAPIGVPSAW